ncbi:transient receptor potential protein-like [Tigriopus californicus]|uniref:transient receptor potential protein-like n=1 Tax=Tigriopus californicus TaxID=6832 RepID=UPI0027D9F6F2|nr:transient receptor potential protein-like [Tigriopus californicus]
MTISKDPEKAQANGTVRAPSLKRSSRTNSHEFETVRPEQRVLTPDEKLYLLNVERGDVPNVKKTVAALRGKKNIFDINSVDPLGRSALIIAIENENLEMMQYLLEAGIETRDSLLVAIREDYVDGVDALLRHEEETHKSGTPYSWEQVDQVTANFTSDITPLILAAQRNNYEILKMLLDRGATIPMPHDVKCSCDDCVEESTVDSLRFSLSRINAYKALASPSLIALSSKDPILTAFELSNELKRLGVMESQFKETYATLRKQVQELATGLVEQARTSYELEVMLNHNPSGEPWIPGETQTLERLKLAIDSNQKSFVTHPSVQQLLAAIWYEGLPGFRRLHIIKQVTLVIKNACMFPIYSMFYVVAKNSSYGKFASKPFVKFINNSASYMFFLFLLALASQRADQITIDIIVLVIPGTEWLAEMKAGWIKHERGSLPTVIEMAVILWVNALLWKEIKAVFREGLLEYLSNMWNIADIASYGAFMNWIGLRVLSFIMVQKEVWEGKPADEIWIPRSQWGAFDPHLLSEGMFGAGMICSFLKLIHIFSINPYLGPLQVSLGKMVIDIAKWLVLYVLVLFSFGCGLNQLLWYYADLERQQCYSLPGGLPDFDENGDSCVMWRRFANLWETSQSLFWAGFGLVELGDFDLKGIKEFTRFWGLLMFGSYSVCNIIVLLNMLIAMMSNSYTIISSRSDIEWKFARSKLWISYFDEGGTVAAPFNLIPNTRTFKRFMFWKKRGCDLATADEKKKADNRYYGVVRCLVRRYITEEQRKSQDFNITEDDINEVRQDINSFRYELINILKMNDMKTPQMKNENTVMGRKSKDLERMIQKGFQMATPEAIMENAFSQHIGNKPKDIFKRIAKAAAKKGEKKDWNDQVKKSSIKSDPIGSSQISIRKRNQSLRRSLLARGNSKDEIDVCLKQLSSEQLVSYNPKLVDYTPATRIAYAKFKSRLDQIKEPDVEESTTKPDELEVATRITLENESISKMPAEPPKKPPRDPELVKASSPIKSATTKLENETLATSSSSAPDLVRKVEPMAQEEMIEPIQPEIIQVSPKQKIVKAEDVKVDPTESTSDLPAEVMVQTSPKKETSLLGNIEVEMVTLPKAEPLKVDQKNATPITLAQLDTAQAEGVESREEKEIAQEEPEEEEEEETRFDPKGKSISTGRNITGWI